MRFIERGAILKCFIEGMNEEGIRLLWKLTELPATHRWYYLITVGNGAEQVVSIEAVVYNLSADTHTVTINVDGNGGDFQVRF